MDCYEVNDEQQTEKIPVASLEAHTVQRLERLSTSPLSGYENYSCVWSNDASYLAWSCGRGKVKVLPWNSESCCLLANNDVTPGGKHLNHPRKIRTFRRDLPIYSLSFGTRLTPQCHGHDHGKLQSRSQGIRRGYRYKVADDVILAAGQKGGRIITWNVLSGTVFLVLLDHTNDVNDVRFAPDGSLRLLSASADGSLKLWHLEDDGNMSDTFKSDKKSEKMLGCAWSPNCNTICGVGDQRNVHLWDITTKHHRTLKGHVNVVSSCVFSQNGVILATSSFDTSVIVWNVETETIVCKLQHKNPVPSELSCGGYNTSYIRQLDIDHTGRYITTVCDDRILRVWDLLSREAPQEIVTNSRPLSCQFSPGAASIAVGTTNGDLHIYKTPKYNLNLQALCRQAFYRNLHNHPDADRQKRLMYSSLPQPMQAFLDFQDMEF